VLSERLIYKKVKSFKGPELNRKRTLILGTISNYAAIFVSIIVSLISVPIGLHYFGPIRYGIWLVIGSILAYLRTADFGVGLSTLTFMAQTSDSAHHRVILRRSISLLFWVSIVLIMLMIVVSHLFPGWTLILGKVPLDFQEEATTAAIAIAILILFQLPTTIFAAAFSGLQQVHWNRAYGALRSVFVLSALVATVSIGGNLITLAFFTGFVNLLVGIISGVHLFLVHPDVRPRVSERVAAAPSSRVLFISGARFLTLQISALIIWNTDNLVISHYLGPGSVTPYAVTFKLFQMGIFMVNAVTTVLWPMYSRASGEGNWAWIQRTYNRCASTLVMAGGLIWVGGIIFSQAIINLWAGPAAYGGLIEVLALGGYVYLSSFGGSNSSLINGLNPTNIVVVFGVIEAMINLGISLVLVKPLGIGGVAVGTFLASLAINSWFPPLYIKRRTFGKVRLNRIPILTHVLVVGCCVILAMLTTLFLEGWARVGIGIIIIIFYVLLSWRLSPHNFKSLVRQTVLGEK